MALRIVEEVGLTDVGRQRSTNEDAFLESSPVFAVADGMGGARAGEVAARIAVETLAKDEDSGSSPEARLAEIARAANRRIYDLAQEDEARSGMGTTLTAVVVSGSEVAAGHVGDSRLYRLRDGELERLTRDHSLVEELLRQGKLTPAEAETHPQRSIITRALGPEPDVEVETFTCPARDGDVYLLCSDGLTAMVPESRVAEIIRASSSLQLAARRLVDAANEGGGKDNVTVVLFRLARDDAAERDADTLTGDETGGLSTEEVREAVAAAEGPAPSPARADRRRAEPAPALPARGRGRAGRRADRTRTRGLLAAAIAALAAAVLVVGFYVGSRQFYFVGTSDRGLVTLYRGLPYDLPLGISLYEENYTSPVPAASIEKLRRDKILDHQLRGRGDARDLVRQLERREVGS